MTASVGEADQPPKYSCGDCEREWTVERRVQTIAVLHDRRAPIPASPTVMHALTTVDNALEALQKAFRSKRPQQARPFDDR